MLLLTLLVAAGAQGGVVELRSLSEVTSVEGEWLFAPGDALARAAPDFDDSSWQRVQVPRGIGEQGHPDLRGHFWYRLHLKGPLPRGSDQVALEIRDVDSAYELYVDGYLVGGHGHVTAPFVGDHDRPGLWRLPLSALGDGEAVIAIRGWRSDERQDARPSRGGLVHGPLRVGPTDVLARDRIVGELDEIVLGGIFFVVGLYHLHLFRRRRALREYLWFGLFSIDLSLYVLGLTLLGFDVMSSMTKFRLAFLTLFMCLPLFVEFLWPFLGRPVGKLGRVFQVACTLWAIVNLFWPTMWFTYKFLVVFEVGLLVPLLIGTTIFIVRRSWQGDPEARTILVGTVFLIVTAANNILRERNILQTPEVTNWAFAVFVLSMAVSLSNRFTRVYGDLDHKNAQLVKMDKLKDEFLANTSHELRTPIHGIIGLAESLADGATGPLAPATVENLRMIVSSGERLSGLVNDILDFSKLREGQLVLAVGPVDVHATVDIVLRLSKPLADKKGLVLVSQVSNDLPPARADEHRLQQILFNLVGNAVKFSEVGTITVRARAEGRELFVDVIDTGIGIDPKDHARVFESFQQADGSAAREYGGTGLGLTVTKQLVELHAHEGRGGLLTLDSAKGRGSRFTFSIPVDDSGAAPSATEARKQLTRTLDTVRAPTDGYGDASAIHGAIPATPAAVPRVGGARFKVLIVDDEPVNLKVLENHLSLNDYEVARAASGPEALALVEKGFRPDLILLDVMMPRMSGFEVCQTLRMKFPATELPVVLVTAKNQVADVMLGFEAGANDYLTKPVAKNELLARIRTHLHVAKMNAATARFVPYEFLSLLGKETLIDVRKGDQVQKDMSILFSDIRSFTSIVEKKTPEENFAFINRYLEHMEPAILENGGFVDSFIGDAIMALFEGGGLASVKAGIAMQRRMPSFNAERATRGEVPIKIGIGINAGPLMLGTIGGSSHIKCGVIGDSVNLASRIEGMTKMYGAALLISETVRAGVDGSVTLREVDRVAAKGKAMPVTIYEVVDADDDSVRDSKLASLPRFHEALVLYRARKFIDAGALFEELRRGAPSDVVFAIYAERSSKHRAAPPPDPWDGVEHLERK